MPLQSFVTSPGIVSSVIPSTPVVASPSIGLPAAGVSSKTPIVEVQVQGPPGPPGQRGLPGISTVLATVVAGELIESAGAPLYINRGDGKAYLAMASDPIKSRVIGVAADSCQAGFICTIARGRLAVSDWTDLAGTSSLTPGATYFLNVGGGITTTPPDPGLGFAASVILGIAADTMTLVVLPQPRILL